LSLRHGDPPVVHLTRHSSTATEQLSCISLVPTPPPQHRARCMLASLSARVAQTCRAHEDIGWILNQLNTVAGRRNDSTGRPRSQASAVSPWIRDALHCGQVGGNLMPTCGTHRVKNPGLEDGVWITDGKDGFEIPESRYRENGYKPRVEELPWRSSTWEGGNAPWPSR
jgi:hypothetical protein